MGDSHTQGERRTALRLVVGALTLWGLLLGVLPTADAADMTPAQSARLGATWLAGQLESQIPLDLFGSADWGVTIDAATALAAVDGTDPLIDTVWDQMAANRDDVVSDGTADVPGSLAKVILLGHATGNDPRKVGSGTGSDLVARLEATLQPGGLYGTQFAGFDGVYRQGLTIAALTAVGGAVDPGAIQWLIGQQCTNSGFEGAFMPFRADTSSDCHDDPASWLGADTNATAMAIMALTYAAADDPAAGDVVDAALAWLHTVRDPQGGWASNSWSGPDANSTAVVTQALIAVDALDTAGSDDTMMTPQQFLMTLQTLDSDEPGDDGAFNYMAGPVDPNLLATVQAVAALASKSVVFEAPLPQDDGIDDGEPAPETDGDAVTTTTVADTSATVGIEVQAGTVGRERSIAFTG